VRDFAIFQARAAPFNLENLFGIGPAQIAFEVTAGGQSA